jgi:hypothetical protein
MQPGLGMFLSRDPWKGDDLRPGSMNGWNYAEGNPIIAVDPSGKIVSWPGGELEAIAKLKPSILASAGRHNTPLTNMDNESFAALMTAILHWEGRLPGNGKDKGNQFKDCLGDWAAILIGYDASTGIANIRPSVALEILREGYKIEDVPSYETLMAASQMRPFGGYYQSTCSCTQLHQLRPLEFLFGQLQNYGISIEFLAANLQRGADRVTAKKYAASVFNLAAWHNAGVQTPDEFRSEFGPKARSYANTMLGTMPEAFEVLFGPGFMGKYLSYNQDEEEFVDRKNKPPYLPIIIKR